MAEFIKPSFEIILQDCTDPVGFEKQIERIGRTCYKSADKITEYSYEGFVDRMIQSKHFAVLEHGTIYLQFSIENGSILGHYLNNKYSKCIIKNNVAYITTNYNVISDIFCLFFTKWYILFHIYFKVSSYSFHFARLL